MYSAHLQSIAELLKAALLLEHDRADEKLLPAHSMSKPETSIESDLVDAMVAWKPQIAVDAVSADSVKVVWATTPGTTDNVDDNAAGAALKGNLSNSHPLERLLSAASISSGDSSQKDSVAMRDEDKSSSIGKDSKSSSKATSSGHSLQSWRVKDYSLLMTTDGTAVLRSPVLVKVLPAAATSHSFESLDPEKSYRFKLRAHLEPIDEHLAKILPSIQCDSDDVFIGSRVELALAFAADAVGPNLKLDGPLTVRNNINKKWNTARASSGFHSGIHSWEVSWEGMRQVSCSSLHRHNTGYLYLLPQLNTP